MKHSMANQTRPPSPGERLGYKRWATIIIAAGLAMVLMGLLVVSFRDLKRYPTELSYWFLTAGAGDWSAEAAKGQALAQLCCGLNLIRSNLVVMTDETVGLSRLPLIGKRYFEKISYSIDNTISQEQLTEAYGWIRKAADQGFAPASEAEKLFIGRIRIPNQGNVTNGSQPAGPGTNGTPPAAGSDR